jgi:hypothetical protein
MVYNTTQHPPTHSHTLTVYTVHLLWEGGGGQREGRVATVHKFSFFILGGNSSQAGSKIPTMRERMSSL